MFLALSISDANARLTRQLRFCYDNLILRSGLYIGKLIACAVVPCKGVRKSYVQAVWLVVSRSYGCHLMEEI